LTNEDLRTAGVHDEHGKPTTAAMGKTVEQRAATSVWCASSGHLKDLGGAYCEDVDIAAVASEDAHGKYGVKPWASAPILAEQLWRASEISWGHVLTLSWP
jgi:hypothetical protein